MRARPGPVFIARRLPCTRDERTFFHQRDRSILIPDDESVSDGEGGAGRGGEDVRRTRCGEMKAAGGRNEWAICKPVAPGDE